MRPIPGWSALAAASLVLLPLSVAADPPWERGRRGGDDYKYEYRDGNCKYEYKEKRGKVKEEWKCDRPRQRHAGPPPWAVRRPVPAGYVPPIDLDRGMCNRELVGTLLGAAAGGFGGAQIGKGDGQLAATAAGTLLGALLGGSIGRGMDRVDQACMGQVLEHAPEGRAIAWRDDRGADYRMVPVQTFVGPTGRYCREYQTTITVGGRPQQGYGTACRQPDGSWEVVD